MSTLAETMRRAIEGAGLDLHVALPAVVERYDAATQRADLRPATPRILPGADEDEDPDVLETLPVLPAVPVLWPRGGGYYLHMPIAPGDSVLVVVCEQDLSAWLRTGDPEADPGNPRRHDLSGAVCIPGLFPRAAALPSGEAGDDGARLASEGGPALRMRPSTVDCGGDQALVRWSQLDAHLSAIATSIQALTAAAMASPQPYGTHDLGRPLLNTTHPPATTITRGA